MIMKPKNKFQRFYNSLPLNQQDSTDFNVRRYWELNGKPNNFIGAILKGMYTLEPDGWHAKSVAYNKETDEYEFMKKPNHHTLMKEIDWYNNSKDFKKKYQLDTTEWKYKTW